MKNYEYEQAMECRNRIIEVEKLVTNFDNCQFFLNINGAWRGYKTRKLAIKGKRQIIFNSKKLNRFIPNIFMINTNGEIVT